MSTTLIVDGNWLLMSRALLDSNFNVLESEYVKEEASRKLESFIAKSINFTLNKFKGVVDNIVIVTDGGSWRKKIERPDNQDVKYKGNRILNVNIDWKYIFSALDNIRNRANNVGITAVNADDIEGDDWIWWWTVHCNSNLTNALIWTSDADLKQLIKNNINGTFTAWYNDRSGLFIHNSYIPPVNDIDFFISDYKVNSDLSRLMNICAKVEYINPEDIVMEKIICGDKSDNIHPIITTKKGNKTYGVTSSDWIKIREKLKINTLAEFFKNKNNIVHSCLALKKFNSISKSHELLVNTLKLFDYNTKLVWLSHSSIPSDIIEVMRDHQYKKIDIGLLLNNYSILLDDNAEVQDLFKEIENDNGLLF